MSLTSAYMTVTNNLKPMLDAIRGAQAPERFTARFLHELGFDRMNDRLIITVLKSMGMLDVDGAPTDRYFAFLDESRWKQVLAEGIRAAYDDLFRLNSKANEMGQAAVKEKLKTLTRGTKSKSVLSKMSATFSALCELADFSSQTPAPGPRKDMPQEVEGVPEAQPATDHPSHDRTHLGLSYTIQVVLPSTRDRAVYDAIFRALKEHIL